MSKSSHLIVSFPLTLALSLRERKTLTAGFWIPRVGFPLAVAS